MRKYAACVIVAVLCGVFSGGAVFRGVNAAGPATCGEEDWGFLRADANSDLLLDINDVTFLSNYLFNAGDEPTCMEAADVNADASINVSDVSYLADYLFNGGPATPEPTKCDCPIEGEDIFVFGCESCPCQ